MQNIGALIRSARIEAGLSQARLAQRLAMSQPAVAKLERPGANPTIATLDRVLRATGRRLVLEAATVPTGVDRGLVRQHLQLTPAQRLHGLETMYREARRLTRAGERLRGGLG